MSKPDIAANHPFGEPQHAAFRPVSQILSKGHLEGLKEKSRTAEALSDDSVALERLVEHLHQHGFRKLSQHVRSGSYAMVLEGGNHQMIRVVDSRLEAPRAPSWDVLQPIEVLDVGHGLSIEVLPKIHTLDEVMKDYKLRKQYGLKNHVEDARNMMEHLFLDNLHRGICFFDACYDNIAVVQDANGRAVPLVLDPGALVPAQQMEIFHRTQLIERCIDEPHLMSKRLSVAECAPTGNGLYETTVARLLQGWLRMPVPEQLDYQGAQEAHLARLGLKAGGSNGRIHKEELITFTEQRMGLVAASLKRTGKSDYIPWRAIYPVMASEGGMYEPDIRAILAQGVADFTADTSEPHATRKGVCHYVKERYEREKAEGKITGAYR